MVDSPMESNLKFHWLRLLGRFSRLIVLSFKKRARSFQCNVSYLLENLVAKKSQDLSYSPCFSEGFGQGWRNRIQACLSLLQVFLLFKWQSRTKSQPLEVFGRRLSDPSPHYHDVSCLCWLLYGLLSFGRSFQCCRRLLSINHLLIGDVTILFFFTLLSRKILSIFSTLSRLLRRLWDSISVMANWSQLASIVNQTTCHLFWLQIRHLAHLLFNASRNGTPTSSFWALTIEIIGNKLPEMSLSQL